MISRSSLPVLAFVALLTLASGFSVQDRHEAELLSDRIGLEGLALSETHAEAFAASALEFESNGIQRGVRDRKAKTTAGVRDATKLRTNVNAEQNQKKGKLQNKKKSESSTRDMKAWMREELTKLAKFVEGGGSAGAQKLGWAAYDTSLKQLKIKSGYTYNSATGDHTEAQMLADNDFKTSVNSAKYVLMWSTQAPCVFGASSGGNNRDPCSILIPNFVATQPATRRFFLGFISKKFAQHEYQKIKKEPGNTALKTDWNTFKTKLQSMWAKTSGKALLLLWTGDRAFAPGSGTWETVAGTESY